MNTSRLLRVAVAAALTAAGLCGCGSTPRPVTGVPAELLDPAVTPENVQQTICRLGYEAAIAPPAAQMAEAQRRLMLRAGIDLATAGTYVLDRVVPIALGGHPTREDNLQLLDLGGDRAASRKQALQRRLHQLVCAGKLGLRQAQAALYPDWMTGYASFVQGEGARQP